MSKILSFPKARRPERTFKQKDIDEAFYHFLLDELLEAQARVVGHDKIRNAYSRGARDWLRNLVLQEMIND